MKQVEREEFTNRIEKVFEKTKRPRRPKYQNESHYRDSIGGKEKI